MIEKDLSKSLDRFVNIQEMYYESALEEIKAGCKESHWMWFIFPQLKGLGSSGMSYYYGIEDINEARAYYRHPILGQRLKEITDAVLSLSSSNPSEIFGYPDDLKFCSCMTLFFQVVDDDYTGFSDALKKFYDNKKCEITLELLDR